MTDDDSLSIPAKPTALQPIGNQPSGGDPAAATVAPPEPTSGPDAPDMEPADRGPLLSRIAELEKAVASVAHLAELAPHPAIQSVVAIGDALERDGLSWDMVVGVVKRQFFGGDWHA